MYKYNSNLFLNPIRLNRQHQLNNNLSFWWITLNRISGAGKAYDLINHIAGTCTTSLSPASSQFGGLNMGDGTRSIGFGSSPSVTVTNANFTISVMFRSIYGSNGSYQGICGKGFLAGSTGGFGIYANAANASCQVRDAGGGFSIIDSSTNITDGNWHHIVMTRSPSLTTLYVDGVSVGTETTAGTAADDNSYNFSVGQNGNGSFPTYNCQINDVRIWKDRALNATEVRLAYQDILTGYQNTLSWDNLFLYGYSTPVISYAINNDLLRNLVGFWPFNATTDTINSNSLSLNGTPTLTGTGLTYSSIYDWNGSSMWATVTNNANYSLAGNVPWTWAGWVNGDSVGSTSYIVSKRSSANSTIEVSLTRSSTGQYTAFMANQAAGLITAGPTQTTSNNAWVFVVVWFDPISSTLNVQANNSTISSAAYTGLTLASSVDIAFARHSAGTSSNYFDGRLEQWGFWRRMLSSNERTLLYNSGNAFFNSDFRNANSIVPYFALNTGGF